MAKVAFKTKSGKKVSFRTSPGKKKGSCKPNAYARFVGRKMRALPKKRRTPAAFAKIAAAWTETPKKKTRKRRRK